MRKIKVLILAAVAIVVIVFIMGNMQNLDRTPDEYTLIFEGDNKKDVWIDIAIQRESGLMYLGSMLLKDSNPTMQDVVETINNSDEGVFITVDTNGRIISINECQNEEAYHWNVYINNKKTAENNINSIRVDDYDGITLMFEQ